SWSCCGVPLKSVEVELQVRDHVATVVSTLNYENKEDKPLEAVFIIPLPGDAAVCHFSATIGQKQIVAEVKEKKQAHEEYDDFMSSGGQAFLLEESDQSPDIFSLSVGSLPPGESASIRLEYVTELAVQADDGLRFCLPAVLNPRYQPQGASVQVTSVPASLVPYSLSFSARVSSPRPVSKVESNCSLDPLQYLNTEQTQATVKLAAGHKFDRDVEVLIYYKDAHQPTAVVEAGQASAKPGSLMGDPVVMLSLYPEFPQDVVSSLASCGEFVFLLDRSGSMDFPMNKRKRDQTRIGSARDTLLLLLKSLPMGCYFNIYSFGTRYEHIFPKSVEYSQKTMGKAVKKVTFMKANLRGTEILKPLQHIHSQPCIPNHPRQVFVFTDGQVGNTKDVISLVKKNSGSHRCFSFGIGEGASSALINGLAKEGGGHAQFITGADRMQPKVMQSLRFALHPTVVDISVTWDLPKEVSVTVLSPPITTLFQGQRSLVYAQLSGQVGAIKNDCQLQPYSTDLACVLQSLCRELRTTDELDIVHQSKSEQVPQANVSNPQLDPTRLKGHALDLTVFTCICLDYPSHPVTIHVSNSKVVTLTVFKCTGVFMVLTDRDFLTICAIRSVHTDFFVFILYLICFSEKASYGDKDIEPKQPPRDPLLQLVSLQKASGCWELDPALADALGKTSEEVENTKPASVGYLWATILAMIWLYGFKMDAQEEWELLAIKAASWLRAQNAPCVTECVEAGNALLGCNVQKDALGL
uniref:VIT domain-containing protein n=1 Tax=Sparus aurata TaxID=8175 RepID=A0A671W7C6_SPAAU